VKRVSVTGIFQCEHLPLEFTVSAAGVSGPEWYTVTLRDEHHRVTGQKRESTAGIKQRLAAR